MRLLGFGPVTRWGLFLVREGVLSLLDLVSHEMVEERQPTFDALSSWRESHVATPQSSALSLFRCREFGDDYRLESSTEWLCHDGDLQTMRYGF